MAATSEWTTTQLGNVATLQRGYDLPGRLRVAGEVPIISSSGTTDWHNRAMVTAPGVVTGRYGTIGQVFYAESDYWPLNTTLYVSNFHQNDPRFVYYVLQRVDFASHSGKSGVPGVNRNDLHKLPVAIPASREEQRAVATALSDIDLLIDSLLRVIAKKQAIKQGMMQQLLTGKTRLPGFTHDWRVRRVGDFAQVTSGGTPSTLVPRYWGGDIRWMSSGELHHKRVSEVTGRITKDGLRESSAQIVPAGTVLIGLAGQGKTRGTAAISCVELATNQSIAGILPGTEHSPEFLYYNLDTRYEELRGMSTGDGGRGGLNLTIIRSVPILMPDVAEQQAIAGVLSDADDDLDALDSRLVKARAVKEGMMQELLTGRTRLQPVEAAS